MWFATGVLVALLVGWALLSAQDAGAAPGDADATYVPTPGCRAFDYRPGPAQVGPRSTPLGAGEVHTQQVTGGAGNCVGALAIPDDAVAVAMNVTIAGPTAASDLRLFPADLDQVPSVSNLNFVAGQAPFPNKVDVRLSPGGAIKLFNAFGEVFVLGDVVGYYTKSSLTELDQRVAALETAGVDLNVLDRITALETSVSELQTSVTTLEASNTTLGASVAALEASNAALVAENTALKNRVTGLETKTASMSSQTVAGHPTVRFTGVNVQIVDGTDDTGCGATNFEDCNGRGNFIIGYNEDTSEGGPEGRTGSHNIVTGTDNDYTSHSGIVAGYGNATSGEYTTITGGAGNTASGRAASVSGGIQNNASGPEASVSGGSGNTASGTWSSVSGGSTNTASGGRSSVSGGSTNTASGSRSSVSGGLENTAGSTESSVSGGFGNTASGSSSSVSGGRDNTASGPQTAVSGGRDNTAAGSWSSVYGGSTTTANGNFEVLP